MTATLWRPCLLGALCCAALVLCPRPARAAAPVVRTAAQAQAVAARFAPVFYQGLGEEPRYDYITNFDFDGDWRGDNNWAHVAEARFPLKAYVYYAVSETATHLFIHYAVFHPRDYKGGETRGRVLSDIINEGVRRGGKYDPTGRVAEATVAHENDMEGCLVVVVKQDAELQRARVVYVETLAHNRFLKYTVAETAAGDAQSVSFAGQRPRLYVEPKGHGVEAYQETDKQSPRGGLLRYEYGGAAAVPAAAAPTVSYALLPLLTMLWPRARKGVNETYGVVANYEPLLISVAAADGRARGGAARLGRLGTAFLGTVGGRNMARPPWGWFDQAERTAQAGAWFFDPARTVKRHFKLGDDFSVAYVWQRFLNIGAAR